MLFALLLLFKMDDVSLAGTKLDWSDEHAAIEEIEEKFGFPQIVKFTGETCNTYKETEKTPVLLLERKQLIRLIAQTVEEGDYVLGKQIEISNACNVAFRVNNDYERNDTQLKTFKSIQKVSETFPPIIYVQQPLTISFTLNEEVTGKLVTVNLDKGDELTIIRLSHAQNNSNAVPVLSFFNNEFQMKSSQKYLIVHHTRLCETLSLPLSLQGQFATQPPLIVNALQKRGILPLHRIMQSVNLPLSVTVATNSTRSVKDDVTLRIGVNLKLIALEKHDMVLGILPNYRIIELAAKGTTFYLPCALVDQQFPEKARNEYQTFVNSALMTSKLQNSPSNVDEYCRSVRFHIPRSIRPTKPTPLSSNACLRSDSVVSAVFQKQLSQPRQEGTLAIQLLSAPLQHNESLLQSSQARSLANPVPRLSPTSSTSASSSAFAPPLPPRNSHALPTLPTATSTATNTILGPPLPPRNALLSRSEWKNEQHSSPKASPAVSETNGNGIILLPNDATNASSVDSTHKDIWMEHEQQSNSSAAQFVSQSEMTKTISRSSTDSPVFGLDSHLIRHATTVSSDDATLLENIGRVAENVETPSVNIMEETQSKNTESAVNGFKHPLPAEISKGFPAPQQSKTFSGVSNQELDLSNHQTAAQGSYMTPPLDWIPPDDLSLLTVEEVAHSLRYIGLREDVVVALYRERIDGKLLVELTDDMLECEFKLNKLYRLKISRFLEGWRPKLSRGLAQLPVHVLQV